MSDANSGLRVPILTVPLEEATVTQGVLRIAGPVGVKFPPRLPFDSTIQVAMAIENPHPVAGSTNVRIAITGPDGAVLPESVRDHTVRWRNVTPPSGPVFNYVIDNVPARFVARGAYTHPRVRRRRFGPARGHLLRRLLAVTVRRSLASQRQLSMQWGTYAKLCRVMFDPRASAGGRKT
jgi:hypothetical protein